MHIWRNLLYRLTSSRACSVHLCERCNFKDSRSLRELHTERVASSKLWFDLDKLESMNRRDLQKLCKKCGLKANSKTTRLVDNLKDFHIQHVADASSILHYPFVVSNNIPSPSQSNRKTFIPSGFNADRNLSLFSQVESPSHWISGEMGKLKKAVKSKGIITKTVGEYEGLSEVDAKEGGAMHSGDTFLTKNASVSAILNSTSNKLYMISRWQKQQIENMGKKKFDEYRKTLSNSGLQFHSSINDILQGKVDESGHFPTLISGLIKSVAKTEILKDLTKHKVLATEEYVTHSSIGYSGTFDALAVYKGVPCVIEWKTSLKHKPSLQSCYDAPLQVVAYAGAINSHPLMRIPVTNCVIIIAHHDESEADVHWMDLQQCEEFWKSWLLKVLEFKNNTEGVSEQNDSM